MKLQEAYFSERNVVGNWTLIGYKAPGDNGVTTNFTYTGASIADAGSTTEVENAWSAKNKAQLNDCASKDNNWTVKVSPTVADAETAASVAFDATVPEAGCQALTPNFNSIGK